MVPQSFLVLRFATAVSATPPDDPTKPAQEVCSSGLYDSPRMAGLFSCRGWLWTANSYHITASTSAIVPGPAGHDHPGPAHPDLLQPGGRPHATMTLAATAEADDHDTCRQSRVAALRSAYGTYPDLPTGYGIWCFRTGKRSCEGSDRAGAGARWCDPDALFCRKHLLDHARL